MAISFIDEVAATPGGGDIKKCIQCGICTGSCPAAAVMDYPPRKLIAMVRAGLRDEVLSSNSMWHCLSCYTCTSRCPRDVKPADIAHALESLAEQHGYRAAGTATPRMYRAFKDQVTARGRVHELGMMMQYYIRGNPLKAAAMLPVAVKLLGHGRMPLTAGQVKGRKELARITRKFRETRGKS